EIDLRTRYSGTPEPDRFKHDRPGEALLVSLESASAPPEVTPLETGSFSWNTLSLELLGEEEDVVKDLEPLLPDPRSRRHALVQILARGRARLEARSALTAAIETLRADFARLEFDDTALATEHDAGDLDAIDRAGALREAADALFAEAGDLARSAEERE